MADDDIERLLREIDAVNGSGAKPANVPAKAAESAPAKRDAQGSSGRLAFAVTAAVVLGVGMWAAGLVLPFVSAVGTGIGGAVAAFLTAIVAGPPRWFSRP